MLLNRKNPHGGDIYANRVRLDFSANINPAGMPGAVRQAVIDSVGTSAVYPDPHCTALRQAIAEAEGVPADGILCGNGAAELIYSYAYALRSLDPSPALLIEPTFCEYELALRAAGIEADRLLLRKEDSFRLTDRILFADLRRYGALFLCSPNNPTGLTVEPWLIRALAETGVRLFFDFCFLDLTADPERYDIPSLLAEYPNVTVLKAFTKSYAMAGLRLGYVLSSDGDFLGRMAEKAPCWNVSVPAQAAGIAALGCRAWLGESVKSISAERERLAKAFSSLGLTVIPGEANFLLLYADRPVPALLRERGILVRDCADYPGLGPGWFRVAVRTKDENDALIAAVREVCS